ncbi:Prolamin-like domain [Arabidopsis suecica]|uniref:Prolamin-like domain n=1 Tax=Arabidopsis suecica TaxID=45249 RepID=A0A8T2FRG8_ARASU|nr:Prolamin-like domain [Arabidopsis suecica]
MKSVIVIVALLCLVSLPNPTVGSTKKPWPKPSDLANHNNNFGDSKVGWACSSSSDPNTPPSPPGSFPNIPQIPGIPNIPFPNIPGIPIPNIPGLPGPPFESLLVSQSGELEKCLSKDGSKTNEKCFSQIFSSWAENDFALDKECCEIIVNMNKRCYGHLHMMFKSHFFAPLLQYSCHIKHAKN